eukprot:CAMPEP_0182449094 /NCGR_PEP_ID=MMETSP1172-20130603/31668_1 /TAXON_ID=708627 /ORGANISM="Timspurckia oligopyrenoides, Strain CCMP3278" /LENGTH=262 /DNA_ID=CAMNT_0024646203 /DNA_START=709 /DNA_END=1497 /DNA_ORIENTATION=+
MTNTNESTPLTNNIQPETPIQTNSSSHSSSSFRIIQVLHAYYTAFWYGIFLYGLLSWCIAISLEIDFPRDTLPLFSQNVKVIVIILLVLTLLSLCISCFPRILFDNNTNTNNNLIYPLLTATLWIQFGRISHGGWTSGGLIAVLIILCGNFSRVWRKIEEYVCIVDDNNVTQDENQYAMRFIHGVNLIGGALGMLVPMFCAGIFGKVINVYADLFIVVSVGHCVFVLAKVLHRYGSINTGSSSDECGTEKFKNSSNASSQEL